MFGFSLEPGQFVVIGDAILRLTEIRDGRVRLAIEADRQIGVTRLDASGEPINYRRRILARRTPADDPVVAVGQVLVVLSCGNEMILPAQAAEETHAECPHCRDVAQAIKQRIAERFSHLGLSGRDFVNKVREERHYRNLFRPPGEAGTS